MRPFISFYGGKFRQAARELAHSYGVSTGHIYSIRVGRSWGWLS